MDIVALLRDELENAAPGDYSGDLIHGALAEIERLRILLVETERERDYTQGILGGHYDRERSERVR